MPTKTWWREGIAAARVHFVGNVMIDTLHHNLPRAVPAVVTLGETLPQGYGVLTLHRPSNVDDVDILGNLLETVAMIAADLPIVFPLHPRTRASIDRLGLTAWLDKPGIRVLPPLGYLEMLGLMKDARIVLTDSGGIQEETTALGVPCLTLRHNTERPITVDEGTNTIVGTDRRQILVAAEEVLNGGGKTGRIPEYWDGRAAVRIAAILSQWLDARNYAVA